MINPKMKQAASAANAFVILRKYSKLTDNPLAKDSIDDLVTDLLTDLMHYCEIRGVKFDEMLSRARVHFSEEN